jgi:hypothetical protein
MVRTPRPLVGHTYRTCRTDMSYLMVYVEQNRGKEKISWPIRQTAVFHRFVPGASTRNLWIFIHPMPNSFLQRRLESSIMQRNQTGGCKSALKLHTLVISSYLDDWRWYLKALNDEFEEIVSFKALPHCPRSDEPLGRYSSDPRFFEPSRLHGWV